MATIAIVARCGGCRFLPATTTTVAATARAGRARLTPADAVERYSVIRNFFKQQVRDAHTAASVGVGPAAASRGWPSQQLSSLRCRLAFATSLARGRSCAQVGILHVHGTARGLRRTASLWAEHDKTGPGSSSTGEQKCTQCSRPVEDATKSTANSAASNPATPNANSLPPPPPPPTSSLPDHPQRHYNLEDYSRFFRQLAMSLPHPHRPTRDDFLNVATSFWQRLRIRFKWFTIKSFRKFNADDISAFITWFVMSQTLWILVGTTTFFSVVFAIANSLQLQHYIARAISDYLTSETGVTIIFESAIVPKWKDSRISFKNVYVSRRPKETPARLEERRQEHMAAIGYDVGNHGHPAYHRSIEDDEDAESEGGILALEEDYNYTMFDLNIDSVDVTLSLWRWLDGKGLVEDAVVRGVRGVVDRRNVFWDPENPLDPALFRHKYQPGDFELERLQLEDVLVTVYQPGEFRPYTASIFRADIRTFRKRWLFYDFLCAENVVGQFDNCLFSLHKPQSIGRTTEKDMEVGHWGTMTRIRIDGVNVDHIQNSTTMEGPISWITSGKVDAVLDIKFPRDPQDGLALNAILEEIADAITTSLSTSTEESRRIPGTRELAKPPISAPASGDGEYWQKEVEQRKVVVDIDLRFRDLKAAVPIFTSDLSYVNNAFIRPIVAFMNANRTLVPIHCRIVKDLSDFDGSWTMWETGLIDEISLNVYEAMAYHVSQSAMNRQRMKTVSWWSLQMTANAIISTLRTVVDPVSAQLKERFVLKYGKYL